jgi:hypothetical protein
MFLDWFTLGGVLAIFGIVAVLAYMCRAGGCGS